MTIHPYWHPTSVVVIDDERLFLDSVQFHLGDRRLCHTFTNSASGLAFIGEQDATRRKLRDFFVAPAHQVDSSAPGDPTVEIRLSDIRHMWSDPRRFQQVSVVVVDYDMPGLNGIEVCRRLSHLPVSRVLLTGKVGLDVAVAAFHEGVIDYFLTKQDPELVDKLARLLECAQDRFFARATGPLREAMSLRRSTYLAEPAFELHFNALRAELGIREYYHCTVGEGMLLVDRTNAKIFLVLLDEVALQTHIEIAREQGAPPALVAQLEDGDVLPVFPTRDGYYHPSLVRHWQQHLVRARTLHGERLWRYALAPPESLPDGLIAGLQTYHDVCGRPLN